MIKQVKIKKAFNEMCIEYMRILSTIYPARGSTGFTEQNLVHNFVICLLLEIKMRNKNAVAWFEFPWGEEDSKEHIDALVYSKKLDAAFYIEAKRFTNTKQIERLQEDIGRICIDLDKKEFSTKSISHNNIDCIKNEYIVELADIWLQDDDWRLKIPYSWMDKGIINDKLSGWKSERELGLIQTGNSFNQKIYDEKFPIKEIYSEIDWIGKTIFENKEETLKKTKAGKSRICQDYCLLIKTYKKTSD